jgi:hypothetical protein
VESKRWNPNFKCLRKPKFQLPYYFGRKQKFCIGLKIVVFQVSSSDADPNQIKGWFSKNKIKENPNEIPNISMEDLEFSRLKVYIKNLSIPALSP